jgi:hypothetical protein
MNPKYAKAPIKILYPIDSIGKVSFGKIDEASHRMAAINSEANAGTRHGLQYSNGLNPILFFRNRRAGVKSKRPVNVIPSIR